MKYCSHCGNQILDDAVVCPKCGCLVQQEANQPTIKEDPNKKVGWFTVLGILIPIAGFIIYLVDKQEYPRKSKAAGKGALIGIISHVVVSILFSIIITILISLGIIGASKEIIGELM